MFMGLAVVMIVLGFLAVLLPFAMGIAVREGEDERS